MYDVILLTDITNYSMTFKTIGTYKIASVLRSHGYSVIVMDHFMWMIKNHKEEVFKWLDDCIGDNTLFVGFGTTFMDVFEHGKSFTNRKLRTKLGIKTTRYDATREFSELMVRLKSYKTKVVLGGQGIQTGKMFNIYKNEIDHWILGLAEDSVIDFVNKIKTGKTIPKIIESKDVPIVYNFRETIPTFSKEDIIFENEVLPLEISRGCRFACKFCSYPLLGRKPTDEYIRSEESLYQEFKYNYDNWGVTQYQILCDTFNETTDKLKNVQNAVKRAKIDINFWCYIRMDLINAHPEQLNILRDLGIRGAFFGIESLYDPAAKAVGKGFGRDKTFKTVEKIKESWGKDCLLHGSFIIGLPFETRETASEWVELLVNRELKIDSVSMNPLRIDPNEGIKTSRFFTSEFDRNAEMYGYKRGVQMNWENENWTYKSASIFASKSLARIYSNAPSPLTHTLRSANYPMALQNGGFSWKEIIHTKDHEGFINKVKKQKGVCLEKYKEDILYGRI